jgi:predicted DsbA family dithiol-disulfide isomerase
MDEALAARMAAAGLPFTSSEHIPSSRKALRVAELARDRGLHEPLHRRLMDAYWGRGEDIGDEDVLRAEAARAGLDADEVEDVLASERYLDRVAASTHEATSIGVSGVPAFLLDGRLLVLGAQPLEVFERAFAQLGNAWAGEDAAPAG